jgi:hypothetical protein
MYSWAQTGHEGKNEETKMNQELSALSLLVQTEVPIELQLFGISKVLKTSKLCLSLLENYC